MEIKWVFLQSFPIRIEDIDNTVILNAAIQIFIANQSMVFHRIRFAFDFVFPVLPCLSNGRKEGGIADPTSPDRPDTEVHGLLSYRTGSIICAPGLSVRRSMRSFSIFNGFIEISFPFS